MKRHHSIRAYLKYKGDYNIEYLEQALADIEGLDLLDEETQDEVEAAYHFLIKELLVKD